MLYVHDIWEIRFPMRTKSSPCIYPKKERKKDDLTVADPCFLEEVIAAEGAFPASKTRFSQTKVAGMSTWTL